MFEKLKVKKAAKRRDHQLSAEDEIILLKCGNDKLIRHYIRKYSFREEVEERLLELCSNSVIRSYLKIYHLSEDAECNILSNDVWASYYMKYFCLCPKGQEKILKEKNSLLCEVYVKNKYPFAEELVKLFIKTAKDELIYEYLKYNSLSEESLKILYEKGAKWLLVYAKNNKLPEEFEIDFLNTASDEEFAEYVKENSLSLDSCLILLEPENKEKLRKYISMHSLVSYYPLDDTSAEEKLFKSKDMDLIKDYIKFHGDEISEIGELELLDLDDKELIKRHIDLNGLYDFSETILMEPGNEEIFKYYAEKCYFSENSQLELLRGGNKELISTYIEHNSLCLEAEKLLMLTRDKELIKNYHKKWQLNDSSWKLLLETFLIDNI